MESNTTVREDKKTSEPKPKKVRKRKLYKDIISRMEFYFSDANLNRDRFLNQEIKLSDERYVPLEIFLKFNKIIKTGATLEDIRKASMKSELLEIDPGDTLIRRKTPFVPQTQEYIDLRTVYVEGLPPDSTIEILTQRLSQYGAVNYITLPKYRSTNDIRGYAFVEFAASEAVDACLEDIGTKDFAVMKPFPKLGNKDMQRLHKQVGGGSSSLVSTEEIEDKPMSEIADQSRKKKRKAAREPMSFPLAPDGTEVEPLKKKAKTGRIDDVKDKKKRQISNQTKKSLRAITKSEWDVLRKEYLKHQKEEMSALKRKLKEAKAQAQRENVRFEEPNKQHKECENSMEGVKLPRKDLTSTVKLLDKIPGCLLLVESTQHSVSHVVMKDLCPEGVKLAFVDVDKTDLRQATVRLNSTEDAQSLMERLTDIPDYSVTLLTGEGEDSYWTKLNEDRKKTFSKSTTKKKGRDKLLEKAAKFNLDVTHLMPVETEKLEPTESTSKSHKRRGKKPKNTRIVFSDSD